MKRFAKLTFIFVLFVITLSTAAFADTMVGSNSSIPTYCAPTQTDIGASGDTEEYYLTKSILYMKGEQYDDTIYRYEFDANGNITARYRAFGDSADFSLERAYEYNDAGQIVKESSSENDWISYEYDENGNLLVVLTNSPYSYKNSTFEYDANGNLAKRNGYSLTVDDQGRVIEDSGMVLEYDASGNITRFAGILDGDTLTTFESRIYDQSGHCVEEILYASGKVALHFYYQYDSNGNMVYSRMDGYDFLWDGGPDDGVWTEKLSEFYYEYEKLQTKTTGFTDVADKTSYYHNAVLWAVKNNITMGTSDTTFSPNMDCSRGQVVAFLWRAAGKPEPKTTECPFSDVAEDAYYYKAVLWAAENGITAGTSANTFSPDTIVTRSQFVTFLWRAAGKPEASSDNPFADIENDYYYNAVLWAVSNGITAGTGSNTFSPLKTCTRAETVTFLYRYDRLQ